MKELSVELKQDSLLINSANFFIQTMFEEVFDTKERIDVLVQLLKVKETASRTLIKSVKCNVLPLLSHGISSYSLCHILRGYQKALDISCDHLEIISDYLADITSNELTRNAYINISRKIREEFQELTEDIFCKEDDLFGDNESDISFEEFVNTSHNFHER